MVDETRIRKLLARCFAGLAGITWLLLIFGSTVRVHGAGLACPDWPLCFGEVVPEFNFQVFLEWGHRQLAGIIGVVFLGFSAPILLKPALRREFGWHVVLLGLVLASQIVLGGLTVLKLLAYWSVTLHLLFGNAFMALLISLSARLALSVASPESRVAPRLLALTLGVMVAIQLALGGLVSSNYAGLACTEWPTCNGGVWFPTFTGIVGLQLWHRLGAYLLTALAVAFALAVRNNQALRGFAGAILALIAIQVVLGVSNVFLAMPVELAVAHAATAHAIVATTTVMLTRVLGTPAIVDGPAVSPTSVVGAR